MKKIKRLSNCQSSSYFYIKSNAKKIFRCSKITTIQQIVKPVVVSIFQLEHTYKTHSSTLSQRLDTHKATMEQNTEDTIPGQLLTLNTTANVSQYPHMFTKRIKVSEGST